MAGFFALLYATLGLGSMAHEDIKKTVYMNDAREKAKNSGNLTYMDGRGNEYFTDTGTLCETINEPRTGHRIIRELDKRRIPTGRILWDYDAVKERVAAINFESALEIAKQKGMKYFQWNFEHDTCCGTIQLTGYDIEQNKKYITFQIGNDYNFFYLSDEEYTKYCLNGVYKKYFKIIKNSGYRLSKEDYYERIRRIDEN